jgi:hypothetical protein
MEPTYIYVVVAEELYGGAHWGGLKIFTSEDEAKAYVGTLDTPTTRTVPFNVEFKPDGTIDQCWESCRGNPRDGRRQ